MKRIKMEGKTFPQGTKVLKFLYHKNDQSYYLCKCTECGNEYRQDGYSTRIGRQGCKYCRTRKDWSPEIINEPVEVGDITRQWWAKRIIQVVKKRRKTRPEFEYNIDMKYAWDILVEQDNKCAYTKLPLEFPKDAIGGTASLDRIDSSKGYVKGNIQWVHTNVNNMKGALTHNEFINICKKITDENK